MIKTEELFERAKALQEKLNLNFWIALWITLEKIQYYGGADIQFNEKIYKLRTKEDAIMLFIQIYDAYRNQYL
jgi:hypothetical protein